MQNTVLLVMDMQTAILKSLPDPSKVVSNVAEAIATARQRQTPVIYVVVGFRVGLPEVSDNNKSFSASRERFASVSAEEFLRIHPALTPAEGEVITTKRRFSAFTGSDLEVLLRAYNARHVVLTGCSTSGVVLSTIREAADKDYRITVLADGCADPDDEVHQVLTRKVFPKQADVINLADWLNDNQGKITL